MTNDAPGIDPARPVPIYFQLKELLFADLASGRLGPGDRLPTEHELCARFGVSRTPVSRALSELAAEGIIVRHRRRGSFVSSSWSPVVAGRAGLSMLLPEAPVVPAPTEAASEVAVDVTPVPPGETNTQLQRLAAEGVAPDVALVDLGSLAPLVDAGLVRPLDVELALRTGPMLGPTSRGAVYAVPAALTLTGLWVRRDVGDVPRTWDQLMRLARIARDTASLGSPIVVDGAGRFAVDALLTVVAANHRSFAGPRFDDEASTEGLRFLRALVGEGLMSSDVVTARPGAGVERMVRGDALALIGASTDVVAFGPAVAEFQFVPFPAGPTGAPVSLVSGWGLVVTRQSRRPELAVRTAVEMARQTDETAAAALGLIPASAAGYATPEDDASSLRRALRSGRPRPWTAGHPVLAAQLERVFEAVVSGRLRPRDAALAAHEVHDAVTAAVLG